MVIALRDVLRATYVASSLATGDLQRSAVVFGGDLQDVGDGRRAQAVASG